MRKRERGYREVFLDANGPGPWTCHGCRFWVQPDELHVHHLDEDPSNNYYANLVAMHGPCHTKLHLVGKKRAAFTAETRRKMGDASRGRTHSAESRAKMTAARTGVSKRQRLRRCGECAMVSTGSAISSHQRSTGHTGRVVITDDDICRWIRPTTVKCQFCDDNEHLFEISAGLQTSFLCGEHIGPFIATWTVDRTMTVVRL